MVILIKFSSRGYTIEKILYKKQHTQRKLLNFENWFLGVKKCLNLTFKVNFLGQKSSESLSNFFSLENINLQAELLLMTFLDKIKF